MATQNKQRRSCSAKIGITLLAALIVSGCGGPGGSGDDITTIPLEPDTILDLTCADVGINTETCILNDPDNPFRNVATPEFNVNDPDALNKFDLVANLPDGPEGAKANFYLWATALARFPSGENQYYTALALHELWDVEGDPIIRDQALKAYRSVLDNFFGAVTFFVFFDGAPGVSFPLNELTADKLFFSEITAGYTSLIDGDEVVKRGVISEWGYSYDLCTDLPACTNGVVSVNVFP